MLFSHTFDIMTLLAQAAGGNAGGGGGNPLGYLPFVLIAMMAYVLFILPQQQKDKRYRQMVEGLKEKDHVITTSGIFGVVTRVQREEERVTIRVDEASGAKIRVAMWGISQVVSDNEPADDAK